MSQNTDIGQGACLTGAPTLNGNPLLPAAELLEVTGSLSTAQLLALNTTAVQAIPAPGSGKLIIVDSCEFNLVFGTTPFAGGGAIALLYGSTTSGSGSPISGTPSSTSQWLGLSANAYWYGRPVSATTGLQPSSGVINQPLNFKCTSSSITTGDSTVNYRIRYRIVPAL